MGTDIIKSYNSFQLELDRAKNELISLNDNIRRIVGRDPKDINLRGDRKRSLVDQRRNGKERQNLRDRESSPPAKNRVQEPKSVFSRLSAPVRETDSRPRLHSRVIRELPSRQEVVAAQGADEESRARNRRMFGSLLGTLQKFCQEESRLKQKEEKKAQIEKKLEEQEIQERENLKKERQNLFIDRKRNQLQIRALEQKMSILKEFEIWEQSKKKLQYSIRTKTKPYIYYKPKVMNEKTDKCLSVCRANLHNEIDNKRLQLNAEIQDIENQFKLSVVEIETELNGEVSYRRTHSNGNNDEDNNSILGNSDEENYSRQKTDGKPIKEEESSAQEVKNSIERTMSSVVVTNNSLSNSKLI